MGVASSRSGDTSPKDDGKDDILIEPEGARGGMYEIAQQYVAETFGGLEQNNFAVFGGAVESDSAGLLRQLRDYKDSLASRTKEELVSTIVDVFKSHNIKASGSTPEEQLQSVIEHLPNTKGKFQDNPVVHTRICKALAAALNKQYTPGFPDNEMLIDPKSTPETLCRKVTEMVRSLSLGMQAEFLDVAVAVGKRLELMNNALQFSKKLSSDLQKELRDCVDSDKSQSVERKIAINERIINELELQLQMLTNTMDKKLAPYKERIELALATQDGTYKMLDGMKFNVGTDSMSALLTEVYSSPGGMANIAAMTNRALKEIGMDLNNYLKAGTLKELREEIQKHRIDAMSGDKDLGKIFKSARLLEENFDLVEDSDDFRAALESANAVGGNDEKKTPLDKRILARQEERKEILQAFLKQSGQDYNLFMDLLEKVANKFGDTIPVDEHVFHFRDTIERLEARAAAQMDLSLVGFYTSASAKALRNRYLAQLNDIVNSLNPLIDAGNDSGLLKELQNTVGSIIKTIDFYGDLVIKKYGGSGDNVAPVEGGAEVVLGGELTPKEMKLADAARSAYDLQKAVNTISYRIYFAQMIESMERNKGDIASFSEKYENILADAVAGRLNSIADERDKFLKEDGTPGIIQLGPEPTSNSIGEENWKEAKKALIEHYDVKMRFYRAVQAMDLYMKAFTDGIASNPKDVLQVYSEMEETEVISRWFVEKTGDSLAKAFENLRHNQDTSGNPTSSDKMDKKDPDDFGAHYYEWAHDKIKPNADDVCVSGLGSVDSRQYSTIKQNIGNCISKFQALKNIINVFARLGSKFGGVELRKQVFMSPTQIYTSMVEYLKTSAISIGLNVEDADISSPMKAKLTGGDVEMLPAGSPGSKVLQQVYLSAYHMGGLNTKWGKEDKLFSYMVKAAGAKIMTVMGMYEMFSRPEPLKGMTDTRVAVGGFDVRPQVIPGAVALYFRLPRLAEFYSDILNFDESGSDEQISMLPESDGVYADLVRQVWVRSKEAAKTGDYSTYECQGLVSAINKIYEHMVAKHGRDKAIMESIRGLVNDINRRFGMISQSQFKKFQKSMLDETRAVQYVGSQPEDLTNFATLPGEENEETLRSSRMAPSDKYAGLSSLGTAGSKSNPGVYSLDDKLRDVVIDFRKKLVKEMTDTNVNFTKVSFSTLIKQAERSVAQADNEDERFEVVIRLIQGSKSVVGVNQLQTQMFNETVVTGLNTLNAIYTQLEAFRKSIKSNNYVTFLSDVKSKLATGVDLQDINNLKGIMPDLPDFLLGKLSNHHPGNGYGSIDVSTVVAELSSGGALTDDLAEKELAKLVRVIDVKELFRRLLLNVFELCVTFDGLVEVRFPNTQDSLMSVDFSGLRGHVQMLIEQVHGYIDQFRSSFSKEFIAKYEGSSSGGLAWIEEKMLDGMLVGNPNSSGVVSGETMETVSKSINSQLVEMCKVHKYGVYVDKNGDVKVFTKEEANSASMVETPGPDSIRLKYYTLNHKLAFGDVLAGLLFYNSDSAGINTGPMTRQQLGSLIKMAPEIMAGGGIQYKNMKAADGTSELNQTFDIYKDNDDTGFGERSAMFMFNQLVYSTLEHFREKGSGKIYNGLIDSFANGVVSQSVMTPGYSHPDMATGAGSTFGIRGDPTGQSLLFSSLATILQRIASDSTPAGVLKHVTSTLPDVALFLRESMRGNLPVMIKLAESLDKFLSFTRDVIQHTSIALDRPIPEAYLDIGTSSTDGNYVDVLAAPINNPKDRIDNYDSAKSQTISSTAVKRIGENASHDDAKKSFTEVINGLNSGIYSLQNIYRTVLKELSDENPVFLQTSENSIQMYKSRNDKLPLMPFSLAMYYLGGMSDKDKNTGDTQGMLMQTAGSPKFQLLYGVRGLLNGSQKVTLGSMPYMRTLLDEYNSANDRKIDANGFEKFLQTNTKLLRYLVNTRVFRSGIVNSKNTAGGVPLALSSASADVGNVIGDNTVYSIGKTAVDILEVVNSADQSEMLRTMHKTLNSTAAPTTGLGLGSTNRKSERLMSLIEMNIMPLNVNALMRSVALANLYNASFTFEQMTASMMHIQLNQLDSKSLVGTNGPSSVKEAFLLLLQDPYREVSREIYGNPLMKRGTSAPIQRIFRGDNGLGMGRPKFLSDQVFNKALFGSVYTSQSDWDEAGPSTGIGAARGRQGWGRPARTSFPSIAGSADLQDFVSRYSSAADLNQLANSEDVVSIVKRLKKISPIISQFEGLSDSNRVSVTSVAGYKSDLKVIADKITQSPDNVITNFGIADSVDMDALSTAVASVTHNDVKNASDADKLTYGERFRVFIQSNIAAPPVMMNKINSISAPYGQANKYLSDIYSVDPSLADAIRLDFWSILASDGNITPNARELYAKFVKNTVTAQLRKFANDLAKNINKAGDLLAGDLNPGQIRIPGTWTYGDSPDGADFTWSSEGVESEDSAYLTYISSGSTNGPGKIVQKEVTDPERYQQIGKDRFDTAIVRNLMLISNVARVVSKRVNEEVMLSHGVLASGKEIGDPSLTEYGERPAYGPNEVQTDRKYGIHSSI